MHPAHKIYTELLLHTHTTSQNNTIENTTFKSHTHDEAGRGRRSSASLMLTHITKLSRRVKKKIKMRLEHFW